MIFEIAAFLLFPVVIAAAVADYREQCRQIDEERREEMRREQEALNNALDAAWRAQLDREQLFRDYVRQEGLQ